MASVTCPEVEVVIAVRQDETTLEFRVLELREDEVPQLPSINCRDPRECRGR